MITRRDLLLSSAAMAGILAADHTALCAPAPDPFLELERKSGGRLGVAIITRGFSIGHRMDERFPMCSTFKFLLAAAVLARVDQGKEHLDRVIQFSNKGLLPHSPVTEKAINGLPVVALCDAAMTQSDNTAANLLLDSLGGPAALTSWLRTIGDPVTRLDRNEPALNESLPGDPRDTTTPTAMLANLRHLVLDDALLPPSKALLTQWLIENTTGGNRIRAGVPKSWKAGDKTGTGERGTANDLAILWPPDHDPILVFAFLTGATVDADRREATLKSVGTYAASLIKPGSPSR